MRNALLVCGASVLLGQEAAQAQYGVNGPSTSVEPYFKPSAAAAAKGYSIHAVSLLTVNDPVVSNIGGYRMVGIPDGLGAYDNGDGTFTVLMNHEIPGGSFPGGNPIVFSTTNANTGVITMVTNGGAFGITRAYGGKGGFVSEWVINRTNLAVVSGRDFTQPGGLFVWDHTNYSFRPFDAATDYHVSRPCSADLAAPGAFYNPATGNGTTARIFLNGEEDGGNRGYGARAFAHVATGPARGTSYELPYLGYFAWENAVACPTPQDLTIVIGLEDAGLTDSQVYIYVGQKQATGLDIEKAGLQYGNTYVLRVEEGGILVTNETNTRVLGLNSRVTSAPFTLFNEGDVSNIPIGLLATNSRANATSFQRVEDGAWDPTHPNDFYFVTTGGASGANVNNNTRLWRLRFTDLANPAAGGTITMMVEGASGAGQAANTTNPVMWDNMCVLNDGRILLQEDVGGNNRLGKIWLFNTQTSELTDLFTADPKFFQTGANRFLTIDEEASGIIDASELIGPGWVLFDVQAHYGIAGELFEGGQLMAAYIAQSPLTSPSTSVEPYYKPSEAAAAAGGYHVTTYALATVGDTNLNALNGYKMVGLPDGMGAFDNGDGTFTLLVNHEIRGGDLAGGNGTITYATNAQTGVITTNNNAALGSVRSHGGKGAFVSKWIFDKTNLTAISGSDLLRPDGLKVWDSAGYGFRNFDPVNDHHISRLCSGDLAPVTAFYNPYTGKGTQDRILLNGEEDGGVFRPGQGGRAFAFIASGAEAGTAYELPYFGLYAWENAVASPFPQDKTVVIGLDDSDLTNSQVYVHIGMKSASGSVIEKAGLQPALTYGIRVDDNGVFIRNETTDRVLGATQRKTKVNFTLHNFGYVTNVSHDQLDAWSLAQATSFQRVEDGAWDPNRPSDFYFVTTGRASGANVTNPSRLWRLCFDDIARPELGGFIELVLDGPAGNGLANSSEQPVMMDNMCFLADGRILIQEDPGNNARLAKIWIFDPVTSALTELAAGDAKFFVTGASNFLTQDEEASGILDMSEILGPGWMLFNVQSHSRLGGELVENGQLNALHFSDVVAYPSVRIAPRSQTNAIGSSVTLSVTPAGTGPFTYQWLRGTNVIAGATGATLTLYNLTLDQAGTQYSVIVTGPDGSVTSTPATVKVNPANPVVTNPNLYFGMVLQGTPGGTYRIEARPAFNTNAPFTTVTNLVLPSSPYLWLDTTTPATGAQKFYRLALP